MRKEQRDCFLTVSHVLYYNGILLVWEIFLLELYIYLHSTPLVFPPILPTPMVPMLPI